MGGQVVSARDAATGESAHMRFILLVLMSVRMHRSELCLSVCLSVRPSVCLSVFLSVCLYIYHQSLSIYPPIELPICFCQHTLHSIFDIAWSTLRTCIIRRTHSPCTLVRPPTMVTVYGVEAIVAARSHE